jgi:hypothetical protein
MNVSSIFIKVVDENFENVRFTSPLHIYLEIANVDEYADIPYNINKRPYKPSSNGLNVERIEKFDIADEPLLDVRYISKRERMEDDPKQDALEPIQDTIENVNTSGKAREPSPLLSYSSVSEDKI